MKKAFTMVEAILVMAILGIIATIMITTLKPAQFKEDTAITQIVINDTENGSLENMLDPYYPGYSFSIGESAESGSTIKILKKYLTATRQEVAASSFCRTNYSSAFYLKDGACIGLFTDIGEAVLNTNFPGENVVTPVNVGRDLPGAIAALYVDTNGDEEPNTLFKDRFVFPISREGIMYAQE